MKTTKLCNKRHGLSALGQICAWLMCLVLCWLMLGLVASAQASPALTLKLGGTPESIHYARFLLSNVLKASGHQVTIEDVSDQNQGHIPMTRLEVMLIQGDINALILGQTAARDQKFLKIPVGMTDNLVNHRILFIPKGSQPDYDPVRDLEDFRQLGKIAAMGNAWADQKIWTYNQLPVKTISGDWRRLYRMVAATSREVDYLPRGAHEMSEEWHSHPNLDVERNLVLIYERDHILYVSPTQPELHQLLSEAMVAARDSGLIRKLAREHYKAVFEPPVNLQERRPILLRSVSSEAQ